MAFEPEPTPSVQVIAEIGCNHQGDFNLARQMVKTAIEFCGVHVVKLQKRTPRELLDPAEYVAPHPTPEHAFGSTYGKHREFLEFTQEQHRQLKAYCEELGGVYSASVWDLTAAGEIMALQPAMIKIPASQNLNYPLLQKVAEDYSGEIHVSFGMTTPEEEEQIVEFFTRRNRQKDLVIYSCVSGYPIKFNELSLLDIRRLGEKFGSAVKKIGFSGHHLGIAADVAAMVLGARCIERHFTLDRTLKGTDHAASLEPDGLRKLVRDLHHVSSALQYKTKPVLEVEEKQRSKMKKVRHA